MDSDFMQIEGFLIPTVIQRKQNWNRPDFTLRENALSVSSSLSGGRDQGMFRHFFLKILIEFISNKKYFCNFGFGDHQYVCYILLTVKHQFTRTSCDSQFFKYLFYNFSDHEFKES